MIHGKSPALQAHSTVVPRTCHRYYVEIYRGSYDAAVIVVGMITGQLTAPRHRKQADVALGTEDLTELTDSLSIAAALCLKAGNAVILRGGSEAIRSNIAISSLLAKAAYKAGIPEGAIQFVDFTDREAVDAMMHMRGYLDVIIPRGGAGLIKHVTENSSVPVIETGTGVCHTFVDASADQDMAIKIAVNAKVSRCSVCNAMETLLVHQDIAAEFLPKLVAAMTEKHVALRGCERARAICPEMEEATEEDWSTEYGDLILSVRVVDDLTMAIEHINRYNTGHSETIVTKDILSAHRFQREVDAAAVYVNASTRFTDGFEFGFGAEIGISTQKLHARGPMGLMALTSTKYLIYGEGQIRE